MNACRRKSCRDAIESVFYQDFIGDLESAKGRFPGNGIQVYRIAQCVVFGCSCTH